MATLIDPVRRTAELIFKESPIELERRLKQDIFSSIARIKPDTTENVDFDNDVMSGEFFSTLSPPLQGIAIARCEGTLAFYNRVGWHPSFLHEALSTIVPEESIATFKVTYHAHSLHDLAYVHPKHFEKILGKAGAASLWERLKQYSASLQP
ncbi:MAG: hypothetical protein V3U65_18985 [Granulosicoccaceae bacterium]